MRPCRFAQRAPKSSRISEPRRLRDHSVMPLLPVPEPDAAVRRNPLRLGWSAFANDTATEMAYWLLPYFLLNVLHAGPAALGIIEGLANGAVNILRLVSGYLTDHFPRRKPFVVAGYAIANAVKPLLALTRSWTQVLALRLADRASAGFRRAPRDVLLAESVEPSRLGAVFGLRQAMDTAGAMLGPLLAFAIMAWTHAVRLVFALAALPGLAAVLIVWLGVHETGGQAGVVRRGAVPAPAQPSAPMPRHYLLLLGFVTLFGLGAFSDLFLILRAHSLGMSAAAAPLLGLLFNAVFAALSWPFGRLSDRWPRRYLVASGYGAFALVQFGFARAASIWMLWPLFAGYGLYHALTDSVLGAWIAELAPGGKRGRAFGWYSALSGGSALLASFWAGLLWHRVGAVAPFYLSALLAALAALGIACLA